MSVNRYRSNPYATPPNSGRNYGAIARTGGQLARQLFNSYATSSKKRKAPPLQRNRRYGSRSGMATAVPTASIRNVKAKKRGRAKVKHVKVAKVNKRFRKKVKQVIKDTKPTGFYHVNHYGTIATNTLASTSGYGFVSIGAVVAPTSPDYGLGYQWLYTRTLNTNWAFQMFTLQQILDAIGVLYMNKLQIMDARSIADTQTRQDLTANNDYLLDIEASLVSCGVNYHFRSNSHRKYKLICYIGTPKSNMLQNRSLMDDWAVGMEDDATDQADPANAVIQKEQTNISYPGTEAANPWTMNASPKLSETVRKNWDIESRTYTLEAGQDFTMSIDGPSNVMIKPKEWRQPRNQISGNTSGQYQHYKMRRGYSKDMVIAVIPDLLPTGDNGAGYYKSETNTDTDFSHMISVKRESWFKVKCPEQAGSFTDNTDPVIGRQQISLTNRKPTYYFKQWDSGGVVNNKTVIVNEVSPETDNANVE